MLLLWRSVFSVGRDFIMLILSAPLAGNDFCHSFLLGKCSRLFGHFKSDRRTFVSDELLSVHPVETLKSPLEDYIHLRTLS